MIAELRAPREEGGMGLAVSMHQAAQQEETRDSVLVCLYTCAEETVKAAACGHCNFAQDLNNLAQALILFESN